MQSNSVHKCKVIPDFPHLLEISDIAHGYVCETEEFKGVDYRVGIVSISHQKNAEIDCGSRNRTSDVSIITCDPDASTLQKSWFDNCVFSYLKCKPRSGSEINDVFKGLSSIFQPNRSLSIEKTIGLWGELFLISRSRNPVCMASCWADKTFDFSSDHDLIEAKTTLGNFLLPHFKLSQLLPPKVCGIACIEVAEGPPGESVTDLERAICSSLSPSEEISLKDKVMKRLGGDYEAAEQCFRVKEGKLKVFNATEIPRPRDIPAEVENLRFQVSLQNHPTWEQSGIAAPSEGIIELILGISD